MIFSYYKMFGEIRAPCLVITSSIHFHKARALRHTSSLSRYNARSLRHQYERPQFTIHFIKAIKKLVPRTLLSCKALGIFTNAREVREAFACGSRFSSISLVFLKKKPACFYNSTMHSARFYISLFLGIVKALWFSLKSGDLVISR